MAHGNNTIPIPGELQSVATEGIVVSAEGVHDYNLNKSQEEINEALENLDNAAYLGDDDGQAVIPGFDPQTDTLHKAAQVLTTAEKDQVQANILDKSSGDGMGKVILKQNLVDGVNTLTQAMMQATNTIYVIRYDYTLASNITVPANCVLEFEGGSINCSNYVITGNKMPTNVIYIPEQFGAGKTSDDTKAIRSCVNIAKKVIMDGVYSVYADNKRTDEHVFGDVILVPSNTDIEMNGQINYLTTDVDDTAIFQLFNVHDVNIHGNGKYQGDKLIHTRTVAQGEWCCGIAIDNGSHDIYISGGEFYNFWGDGVYVGHQNACYNVTIEKINVHDYLRNGISICSGYNHIIKESFVGANDKTTYNNQSMPSINIETHKNNYPISDVTVKDCTCTNEIKVIPNGHQTAFEDICIDNVKSGLHLYNLANSCVIKNTNSARVDITFDGNTYIQTNIPRFYNCSIAFTKIDAPAQFNNCNIYGLNTHYLVDSAEGITFNNCRFEFVCDSDYTNFKNSARSALSFFSCDVVFKDYTGNTAYTYNSTFIKCNIDFYKAAWQYLTAIDCVIKIRLIDITPRADEGLIYNYTTLYGCTIEVLKDTAIPLYFLNRSMTSIPVQPLINEGSVVIDVLGDRTKTYGSGSSLYDAGTIYIKNHIV